MGERTAIAWTDHTFNPWWGCARVSPGCQHCYAETFAKRTGHDIWGKNGERRFFGDKHWAEPVKWNRQAEAEGRRHRVFCASMADVFEERPDLQGQRDRLWELIDETPWLDWQLLTKRPFGVMYLVPHAWRTDGFPPNVWIGTTVEDAERARDRIPSLAKIPARVRFLSCEPLLEPITEVRASLLRLLEHVDWVIVGGESGPGHRPLSLKGARDLRDACRFLEIPFFFKQVGGRTPSAGGDELDGERLKEFPRKAHVCLDCCSVGGFDTREECVAALVRLMEFAGRVVAEQEALW